MSRRFLALMIGVAVVIVAVVALLRLAPGQASNETVTPWGEPDLQGIWTSDAETPLQRPARVCQQRIFYG